MSLLRRPSWTPWGSSERPPGGQGPTRKPEVRGRNILSSHQRGCSKSPGAAQRSDVRNRARVPTYPASVVRVGLDDGTNQAVGARCILDGNAVALGPQNDGQALGIRLHANGEHQVIRLGGRDCAKCREGSRCRERKRGHRCRYLGRLRLDLGRARLAVGRLDVRKVTLIASPALVRAITMRYSPAVAARIMMARLPHLDGCLCGEC